jgi:hypothetical protein
MPQAGWFWDINIANSSHVNIRGNRLNKADTSGAGYSYSSGIYIVNAGDNSVIDNQITAFYNGIVGAPASASTNGNVIVGATVPVTGTTGVTTY